MTDVLVKRLADERGTKKTLVESYASAAADEGRDLTASELETISHARSRIAELDLQISAVAEDLEMADGMQDRLRSIDPASVAKQTHYRSAGELFFDVLHQSEEASRARYGQAQKRAAQHMGTDKANTVATAGDLGGLTVSPTVGPIIDPYPRGMPLANAIGLIQAPSSMHFMLPRLDDPDFATGVAVQTKEKEELASKKFDVTADPVALATVGGYINVSQQLQSLQAGSLDLIIGHMNRRLSGAIDRTLVAELTKTTSKGALAADADAATILKAIFDASAAVFTKTGEMARAIVMGPLGYARLGSLVDAAGRPMFNLAGSPSNTIGGAMSASDMQGGVVAGLQVIVTPGIADAEFFVIGADSLTGFIYRFPILEAVEPSLMGRQVAVAAAVAAHQPIANSAVHLSAA